MEVPMPTLEERLAESPEELKKRMTAKTTELGITHNFAQYIEMMETYILKLERRVKRLENDHGLDSESILEEEDQR